METMREKWTDERLDDLSHRVADGFGRVDADLRALRTDTKAEFGAMRSEMNTRFEGIENSLRGMQRTMLGGAIALSAAIVAGFGAIATQL